MENKNRAHKHLSLQERYDIEDGLNKGYTVSAIARKLDRDRSTIAKEIKKHRIGDETFGLRSNDCMYRQYCQKKVLCNACGGNLKKCSSRRIRDCMSLCVDYRSEQCMSTLREPYVCNGCHCTYECRKPHFYYRANVAYDTYKALLKDARDMIGLTREELRELDCLITPLLKQGQSISHIFAVHKSEILCSMKIIYNYIDQGVFTARNLDLPKKVKYKERKRKRQETPTDYAYREKRTYKDFLEYMKKNHEYFRKVIPKGKSLADYTQDDMTLLMNHINSTARASLNGRNPYELARLLLKKELFKVTGAKKVAADEILLKPALLKR